jgi:pyruvate/2-oxoglutarate dehydrogenase complex dihydrolipoamide dehydrogenase (E3) component
VPSKSLIAAATLAHRMRHADSVGLAPTDPNVDFASVMDRVQRAIHTIEAEDPPERLRNAGIDLIHGSGRFAGPGRIEVDDRELRWRSAIIATGSTSQIPPIPGLDDTDSLTTDTVWELRELPGRLVVLGGGPVGCELAQALTRLGSHVTIIEMADRLLLKEDPRVSELIASRLREEGVDVRLGQRGSEVRQRPGGDHELVLEGSREAVSFERIIVATGRAPSTAGLGLETVGVELDRAGAVAVNGRLRTSARGIFAVGDVTGLLPFTHVAAHHARVATPNALFKARGKVSKAIPWVTFTDPEVGRVGLTEGQARERWGEKVKITEFEYAKLDRAITAGEAYGFAKLIADPRGRLVGATVAAPGGGDAIAELTAWLSRREKIDAVSRTVHAYPTLAEGPARAADEYLEARYTSPRMRAFTRRALAVLRLLPRRR